MNNLPLLALGLLLTSAGPGTSKACPDARGRASRAVLGRSLNRRSGLFGKLRIVLTPGRLASFRRSSNLKDSNKTILTSRSHDIEAPDIPGCPGNVPHQSTVTFQLRGQVELLRCRGAQAHAVRYLFGAPNARSVHTGHYKSQRVSLYTLPNRVVTWLQIGIEGNLERRLLSPRRFLAHNYGIYLSPAIQILRLLILVQGEFGVAFDQRKVGVSGFRVVFDRKG